MIIKNLTCIECPMGCQIQASIENEKCVDVKGNGCPRGKIYAESEVVCPMRIVTSTVKTDNGKMLPVKTDSPIKKAEIFEVMEKINQIKAKTPVRIGDVLKENIADGVNLIATSNIN